MSKRKIIKIDHLEEDEFVDGVEYQDYYIEQVEQDEEVEQDDEEIEESLEDSLRVWAIKYKIAHAAIDDLLRILIGQGITNLPATSNILLRLNQANQDEVEKLSKKMRIIEDSVETVKSDINNLDKKLDLVLKKLNNQPRVMPVAPLTARMPISKVEFLENAEDEGEMEDNENFGHYIETLPMNNPEEIQEFNNKLYDERFKNYMFRYVRIFTSKSPTKTCKLITSNLMTDELLEQYSWVGRDAKKGAFNVYEAIINLIFKAVVEQFPYTTYQDLTNHLRDILKHAPFRLKRKAIEGKLEKTSN